MPGGLEHGQGLLAAAAAQPVRVKLQPQRPREEAVQIGVEKLFAFRTVHDIHSRVVRIGEELHRHPVVHQFRTQGRA